MPDIHYPLIAERLFNTPLLVMPAKLDAIIAGLSSRLGFNAVASGMGIAQASDHTEDAPGAYTTYTGERRKPGYRLIDGVGVIDIFGALTHRTRMAADSTWLLGYDTVARMFEAAIADHEVGAIVLNLDSPGGEVGGVFDLAEQIHSAREIKPIHAIAGNLAASAAYLLASATSEISITSAGMVGSIGVVMRHADWSVALEQDGIKVTHIFAGAHKIDGNPYQALPDGVRAQFQEEIDALYNMFVAAVSDYRATTPEAVRGTEAQIYLGEKALGSRLADRVETPDQLITRLADTNRQTHTTRAAARATQQESTMTTETETAAGKQTVITQAQVDTAREEGIAQGKSEGATAERDRIRAILTLEQAEGRQAQAQTIALETDLGADAAAKLLSASPQTPAAAAGKTGFEQQMALHSNSNIEAGAGAGDDDDLQNTVQRVLNA